MDCDYCGIVFFGRNTKFCSMKCYQEHLKNLKTKSEE